MSSSEDYCRVFDLTCRIPDTTVQSAIKAGQLVEIPVTTDAADVSPCRNVLVHLKKILANHAQESLSGSPGPIRICIPFLGSSSWGDVLPQEICHFLFSLRGLLRRYPNACASISLPPRMCTDAWGGPGWVQKLGWLTDACITLAAFAANPSLTAMFSSHHGLVHIHTLPAPHTLLPPSDRFSTLRGLSASGENNLAFKCMRKRLIFETLHLDLEGGVGERRTTPSANAIALDDVAPVRSHVYGHADGDQTAAPTARAAVHVEIEQASATTAALSITDVPSERTATGGKKTKVKKKVAFMSDRPDLYDF